MLSGRLGSKGEFYIAVHILDLQAGRGFMVDSVGVFEKEMVGARFKAGVLRFVAFV